MSKYELQIIELSKHNSALVDSAGYVYPQI